MEKQKDYGTISDRFGMILGTPWIPILLFLTALNYGIYHSLRMAFLVIGASLVIWIIHRLTLTFFVTADPKGITFGTFFKRRRVLWADITKAERIKVQDVQTTFVWVGQKRIELNPMIGENWPLNRLIWRYLRYHVEDVSPPSRKKREQA